MTGVQGWLFTEAEQWALKAEAEGVLVVRKFDKNAHGTPMLSFMYRHVAQQTGAHAEACRASGNWSGGVVFDAYANGDIVFGLGLVDTLMQVRRMWARTLASGERKGVLVVGKRTNVNYHVNDKLESDDDVTLMVPQHVSDCKHPPLSVSLLLALPLARSLALSLSHVLALTRKQTHTLSLSTSLCIPPSLPPSLSPSPSTSPSRSPSPPPAPPFSPRARAACTAGARGFAVPERRGGLLHLLAGCSCVAGHAALCRRTTRL